MEAEDQEESAKGNKSGDKKDEKTKKEFKQLRDSKPTRQVVRVPTQKWETESQDVIDSIVNREKSDKKTPSKEEKKRKNSGESKSGDKKPKS